MTPDASPYCSMSPMVDPPEFYRGLLSVDGESLKAKCRVGELVWSVQIGRLPFGISDDPQHEENDMTVDVCHYRMVGIKGGLIWTYHYPCSDL